MSTVHIAQARTNADVFQAFADGDAAYCGNVSSRPTTSGALALYSYSTPVALRDAGAIVVDDRRYSVTTSKQVTGTILPGASRGLDVGPRRPRGVSRHVPRGGRESRKRPLGRNRAWRGRPLFGGPDESHRKAPMSTPTGNARGGRARWRVTVFYAADGGIPATRFVRVFDELHDAYRYAATLRRASSIQIERVRNGA